MVGTHVAAKLNLAVLVCESETSLLGCDKTTATATESTSAAIGEPLTVEVVGRQNQCILRHIVEVVCHVLEPVAVLCSVAGIGIGEEAVSHALLHLQVEHSLLLAVINACNARKIALLVIELDLVDSIHRDILECHILVCAEEVLSFHKYAVDRLAVKLYGTVILNCHSRVLLYEFFEHRALCHAESRGVIHQCISRSRNGRNFGNHQSFIEQLGILLDCDFTKFEDLA